MSSNTPPLPMPIGDFAAGERTDAETPEEVREEGLEGDFAAGERTIPLTPGELSDESLHGDFAGGERTEPRTPEEEIPGTFADTDVQVRVSEPDSGLRPPEDSSRDLPRGFALMTVGKPAGRMTDKTVYCHRHSRAPGRRTRYDPDFVAADGGQWFNLYPHPGYPGLFPLTGGYPCATAGTTAAKESSE